MSVILAVRSLSLGGLQMQAQPGIYSETLSQKKKVKTTWPGINRASTFGHVDVVNLHTWVPLTIFL
jgi:hypothetical protein